MLCFGLQRASTVWTAVKKLLISIVEGSPAFLGREVQWGVVGGFSAPVAGFCVRAVHADVVT